MTDCTNVGMRERLPELLHGTLDTGDAAALQEHLADCVPCSAELALLRDARAAMSRVPAVNVARIVAALPAPPARPRLELARGGTAAATTRARPPVAAPRWRRMALAAALLLTVGVSGVTLARLGGSADQPAIAGQGTATGADDGRLLAVNVVGLTEADFAGLLDELDDLEALPDSDPRPIVPVESSLGSEGGD